METPLSPRCGKLGRKGQGGVRLAAEAALRLTAAWAALRVRPFERVVQGLGDFTAAGETDHREPLGRTAEVEIARAVAWAVAAAARRMPFEATCLPQAIAAQAMLRRRGVAASVYLGAGRDEEGRMEAHAWVDAAGIGVTGHPVPPQLRKFGRFVAPL
jgi:transglutaminase superfamily protein